jgi:hypothetical protein
MADLYSSLQIHPGIGTLHWDFNNLRKFDHLKYVELICDNTAIYKQGSHSKSLAFEDWGKGPEDGLSHDPRNYQVAVVGVAPSKRKCKKKWVLNIRGIHCYYPDLPSGFAFYPENSCIYFSWQHTPTELLKKIILKREDGLVLYDGKNQSCVLYDDNQGQGLEPNMSYHYVVEMVYHNHRCDYDLEIEIDELFDSSRLQVASKVEEGQLHIHWNHNIDTSITNIGCRIIHGWWKRSSLLSNLFRSPSWVDFEQGHLQLKLPAKEKGQLKYQMAYLDYYGNVFYSNPEVVTGWT